MKDPVSSPQYMIVVVAVNVVLLIGYWLLAIG
jgi:hypothetical protein